MKTALVTTCWLGNQDYIDKTKRWINYYSGINYGKLDYYEIILLDNASPFEMMRNMQDYYPEAIIQRFPNHLSRISHLEYPYLWRAIDFFQEIFKEFDKIVYMDNDFYIISDKMFKIVNNLKSTWWSPYCNLHNFPETGLQVITKDSKEYADFIKVDPILYHGKKCMETTLPVQVDKSFNGDRFGEFLVKPDYKSVDFWAQATLSDKIC